MAFVQRLPCAGDQHVALLAGDHQRGGDDHAVSDVTHDEVVGEAAFAADEADGAFVGLELGAGRFVGGEGDAAHHAGDSGLAYEGLVHQRLEIRLQVGRGFLSDVRSDCSSIYTRKYIATTMQAIGSSFVLFTDVPKRMLVRCLT